MAKDDECLEAIKEATGRKLRPQDHDDILKAVKDKMSTGMTATDAATAALADHQQAYEENRYGRLMDLQKAAKRRSADDNNIAQLMKDNPKMSREVATFIALDTKNRTDQHPITGAYDNYENNIKLMTQMWDELPRKQIAKTGLTEYLHDPANVENIMKEMYAASDKTGVSKPGITKDGNAKSIADIYTKANASFLDAMRKEGVFIKESPTGYAARRTYDPEKFHPETGGADFAGFKADVEKYGDLAKINEGRSIDNWDSWLKDIYDNFRNGKHLQTGHEDGFDEPGYKPTAGKSAQYLQKRVLYWKDADSEIAIAKKYGSFDNFGDMMATSMQRNAKGYAAIRQFGKDAAYWHQADIDYQYERMAQEPGNAAYNWNQKGYAQKLQHSFQAVDGTFDTPYYKAFANIESAVKSAAVISSGPAIPLVHFFSLPATQNAAMRHIGGGPFTGAINSLSTWLKVLTPLGGKARQEAADLASSYAEGVHGHLFADHQFTDAATPLGTLSQRLHENPSISGVLSTIKGSMMNIGGMSRIMGLARQQFEVPAAKILRDNLKMPFNELDKLHQSTLEGFNIKADDWKLMQGITPQLNSQGIEHVTPPLAYRIPDEDVKGLLTARGNITEKSSDKLTGALTERYKDDLARRIWLYLQDNSKMSIGQPGSRTADALGNSIPTPNSSMAGIRMMVNLATFFKQWPTEVFQNMYGRDVLRQPGKGSATMGVMSSAALLTIGGYMTLSANALRQGETPPDPTALSTWRDAALRGGAGTVISDYVGNAFMHGSNPKESAADMLTGILGSKAFPVLKALSDGIHGKDTGKDMAKLVGDNFPKLWYTQLVANYLLMWNLYEHIDPGWEARDERNKEKYGTPYMTPNLRPTQPVARQDY